MKDGFMKRFLLLITVSFSFLSGITIKAQNQLNSFNLRYNVKQTGGIVYVSNTILTCPGCEGINEAPPNGKTNNNGCIGEFVDVDNSAETFNSSSASLNLPEGASVTFAGIYWGASASSNNSRISERKKVWLMMPGKETYVTLTADGVNGGQYFKDITRDLNSLQNVNGVYTAANIVADTGIINVYAGWTIVVVYRQNSFPLRDLSVFDGWTTVYTKNDLKISGFFCPPIGPVNFDFGFVAYDGDRGGYGDYLLINNEVVFDQLHAKDNTFNSSLTSYGIEKTDINPALRNTLGYDASIIHLDNYDHRYLGNSATSALISLQTAGDVYTIGVLTTAIDIYDPSFSFFHNWKNLSRPDESAHPDDVIEFEYDLKNIGDDKSTNTIFMDTIPSLTDYIPGSMAIQQENNGWVTISDKAEDDIGEYRDADRVVLLHLGNGANATKGGDVIPEGQMKIKYQVRLVNDCDIVRCSSGRISKYGWLRYSGNVNALSNWKVASNHLSETGNSQGEMLIPLSSCDPYPNITANIYCQNTPITNLNLPSSYYLYKTTDTTLSNPLPYLKEAGTYKAYRKLSSGCEYSFNVTINADYPIISAQPQSAEVNVGSNATFSIGVSGGNMSYQWQVNTGNGSWQNVVGGITNNLTISSVTAAMDGYRYRVMMTSPCNDILYSDVADLKVIQPVTIPVEKPDNSDMPAFGSLFVPNAFMPASRIDELRHFLVKGRGLSKWELKILNKWDQVIWKTNQLNGDGSPVEGWDGKMFGSDAPQGAYMWVISAVFNDGSEWKGMSVRDSKPRKSGVVYLLR